MRFALTLAAALTASTAAHAQTTWHVPEDVSTIQEAIDVAVSGDTILVAPGTYYENLDIQGEVLTLRSLHGPRVTIVDGQELDSVVKFSGGANGVLDGFTLRHGYADFGGGGINSYQSSPAILNCIVRENEAGWASWDIGVPSWSQVQFSNFGSAPALNGNIDAPPEFVNATSLDFHLRSSAPCRDAGLSTAPGLLPTDFEGNDRGTGGVADMGADEYAPHLYMTSDPSPGQIVSFVVVGLPTGTPCSAWLSPSLMPNPLSTIYGDFWLAGRRVTLFNGKPVGPGDLLRELWTVPPSTPAPSNLFAQGLLGTGFSAVEAVRVE